MPRFLFVPQREMGEREREMTHGPIRVFCVWRSFESYSFQSKEKDVKGHAAPLDPEALHDSHTRLLGSSVWVPVMKTLPPLLLTMRTKYIPLERHFGH